ncbi:hypothetical protein Dsin_017776 [Dipteronia sinensis]|uniref:Uncharacterized protein n=1 Tax=Dipteronia sinensis TaxID=43782 RepID=A0AAE0AH18_9ROSI|nr:hypothetical protein Dsin_017776 [Dipteronia sinensis]
MIDCQLNGTLGIKDGTNLNISILQNIGLLTSLESLSLRFVIWKAHYLIKVVFVLPPVFHTMKPSSLTLIPIPLAKPLGFIKDTCKNSRTPLVGDEKPSLKPKKSSNEIDEIFAGKKRKKPEGKKTHKSNKDDSVESKLKEEKKEKKKSKRATNGDFADPPADQPRKRSEDGLAVDTEEELGISKADTGNTPLCPFDCPCCF